MIQDKVGDMQVEGEEEEGEIKGSDGQISGKLNRTVIAVLPPTPASPLATDCKLARYKQTSTLINFSPGTVGKVACKQVIEFAWFRLAIDCMLAFKALPSFSSNRR